MSGQEESKPTEEVKEVKEEVKEEPKKVKSNAELLEAKAQIQEQAKIIEQMKSSIAKEEETRLKESNNWKQLYEKAQERLQTVESEFNGVKENLVAEKKLDALRTYAVKHKIKESALEDLEMYDHSSVVLETTNTGKISVLGAEERIVELKALKPHWFGESGNVNVNSGAASMSENKTLSPSQILELQKKDPSAYNKYMRQRLKKN